MLRRRKQDDPDYVVKKVPDDLPPTHLAAPLRVDQLVAKWDADGDRAEFRVVVRDAQGQRCPNVSVEATVVGPTREAAGQTTTSIMGAATFWMADGPGTYRVKVTDVGAHGIDWDAEAGAGTTAELTSP